MDFKTILGDLYTDDIGNKINESGIKFADLNTGEYVSKKKYDDDILKANNTADDYKKKYETVTKSNEQLIEENNGYKYKEIITDLKVDSKFSDYVKSEALKGMTNEIDFKKSAENFIEKNPQFKKTENVRRVNSSFSVGGNNEKNSTPASLFNDAILRATGRKN